MKYFLDCEFNGYRGELISLALVCNDGRELYLAHPRLERMEPWVAANVEPIVTLNDAMPIVASNFAGYLTDFFRGDPLPHVVADWPDDIRYLCECLITGPGQMINIPCLRCDVERVDAYPTDLVGAVQHNALWDARALKAKLTSTSLPPGVYQH
jgi:hypothetical protein